MNSRFAIRTADVRRRFDRAADTFDKADFVHATTRTGLFERLEGVVIDAKVVLDLGCATGAATRSLAKRFRGSQVVAIDVSRRMLARCAARRSWFSRVACVQADASTLPFADNSVDVVFSNLLLPWINDIEHVASEVARVLQKGGLFAFATLGPDSLLDLRRAWQAVDDEPHVNAFFDMHDIGDALVRSGLMNPVLDVDRLQVSYTDTSKMFADLTACGARNALADRHRSLTGRNRFNAMREYLLDSQAGAGLAVDFELVYGHCFGSGQRSRGGETRIDASAIPVRGR